MHFSFDWGPWNICIISSKIFDSETYIKVLIIAINRQIFVVIWNNIKKSSQLIYIAFASVVFWLEMKKDFRLNIYIRIICKEKIGLNGENYMLNRIMRTIVKAMRKKNGKKSTYASCRRYVSCKQVWRHDVCLSIVSHTNTCTRAFNTRSIRR